MIKNITLGKVKRYLIYYINNKMENSNSRKNDILKVMLSNSLTRKSKRINRRRLFFILKHAYKNVPFYFQNYKQLEHLKRSNVYEVLKTLPLLSKDTILKEKENIYIRKFDKGSFGWMNTGGSTGEPLSFPVSHSFEDSHQKALYEFCCGKKYKGYLDKVGAIVSFDGVKISELNRKKNIFWEKSDVSIYGSYNFSSFELNIETYKYYVGKLNEIKPKFFRGYTSAITDLASYILQNTEELDFHLDGIYLTSENITTEDIDLLTEVFKCSIFGQYGHSEVSVFAWTEANSLRYHFSPFYGYTEILDEDGNDVEPGQVGEIVVTGFSNRPLPFIRYKTGDLAIKSVDGDNCQILFTAEKLMGRTTDFLYDIEGRKVFCIGPIFGAHLHAFENIQAWQLEQTIKGYIKVYVNKLEKFDKKDEDEIIQLFERMNIKAEIIFTDSFKLSNRGKRKFILQNIK